MSDNHAMDVMHSSEDPNWRTPDDCFQALDREWHFNLDGAADGPSSKLTAYLGPGSLYAVDALTANLTELFERSQCRIFLNPPFSSKLASRLKAADDPRAAAYDIANWAEWAWRWSQVGYTIVGLIPFAPQTKWYRRYVLGHGGLNQGEPDWIGHAAMQERRLPHRISFMRPDGSPAANAGVNTAIVTWQKNPGIVGPWVPHSFYWSYRD